MTPMNYIKTKEDNSPHKLELTHWKSEVKRSSSTSQNNSREGSKPLFPRNSMGEAILPRTRSERMEGLLNLLLSDNFYSLYYMWYIAIDNFINLIKSSQ